MVPWGRQLITCVLLHHRVIDGGRRVFIQACARSGVARLLSWIESKIKNNSTRCWDRGGRRYVAAIRRRQLGVPTSG